jgi:hypothetical protein
VPFSRPRDPAHLRAQPPFTKLRLRMWELLRSVEPERMEAAGG